MIPLLILTAAARRREASNSRTIGAVQPGNFPAQRTRIYLPVAQNPMRHNLADSVHSPSAKDLRPTRTTSTPNPMSIHVFISRSLFSQILFSMIQINMTILRSGYIHSNIRGTHPTSRAFFNPASRLVQSLAESLRGLRIRSTRFASTSSSAHETLGWRPSLRLIFIRPAAHVLKQWMQRDSFFCQFVFEADRVCLIGRFLNQTVPFHSIQPIRQDVCGDSFG